MFFVTVHSVTQRGVVATERTCASCNARWKLLILALGVGASDAPLGLGSEKARQQAATAVRYDMEATARRALELVDCKGCGKPLILPRRHWLAPMAVPMLVVFAACLAFPFVMGWAGQAEDYPPWAGVASGALLAGLIALTRRRDIDRARDAARQIEWISLD